jgi:hypothetical protein
MENVQIKFLQRTTTLIRLFLAGFLALDRAGEIALDFMQEAFLWQKFRGGRSFIGIGLTGPFGFRRDNRNV